MGCVRHPVGHIIVSLSGFRLLEEVEGALGTTEQRGGKSGWAGRRREGGAPTGNPTTRIALFVRPSGTKFAASNIVEQCTMRSLS